MMVDEKLEPAAARNMVQGEADRLDSAFHLGYNMILNLSAFSLGPFCNLVEVEVTHSASRRRQSGIYARALLLPIPEHASGAEAGRRCVYFSLIVRMRRNRAQSFEI